jgi:hypothetical protein
MYSDKHRPNTQQNSSGLGQMDCFKPFSAEGPQLQSCIYFGNIAYDVTD